MAKIPRETSHELFIGSGERALDASGLRRDLARILLCSAASAVVMFSSLAARLAR